MASLKQLPRCALRARISQRSFAVAAQSCFRGVEPVPPDAILGLVAAFKQDPAPRKVSLVQGAYRTDEGLPYVLGSVKEAESRVAAALKAGESDKEYLGIAGHDLFRTLTAKLVFGEQSRAIAEGRVATLQTISGTGALSVAAGALKTVGNVDNIYLSNPSWGNHAHVFNTAGFKVKQYTYLDKGTGTTLDFDGMVRDLEGCPEGSAVLLHACAHNPTGIDPTHAQWEALADLFLQRKLIPFFDSAYQGYASGDLDVDAASVRLFEEKGLLPIVCQSYAKSLGLYGERIGAVNFVCGTAEDAAGTLSQVMQKVIRPNYSSPPLHGARLAATILSDPELFGQWREDLKVMAGRVSRMRSELQAALRKAGAPSPDGGDWSHVTSQIGMFAFTGLSPAHVDTLLAEHRVYLTRDGRMSVAALKPGDVEYVANAIRQVLTK